jgi:hypothetical protein
MKNTSRNYLIAYSGNDTDEVVAYRVFGTEDAVKKHILDVVEEICSWYEPDDVDSIPENAEEIHSDTETGELYTQACFCDCHYNIAAVPEEEPVIL